MLKKTLTVCLSFGTGKKLQKHGVAFEDAALVFADENAIVFHDDEHSQDEDRWQIIGLVEDVLLVVYTERGKAIRLITARAATPNERREYYGLELYGMQYCLPIKRRESPLL